MKAVVAAFNQEKALVGAFSVFTNLRMELFEALVVASSGAARFGIYCFSSNGWLFYRFKVTYFLMLGCNYKV